MLTGNVPPLLRVTKPVTMASLALLKKAMGLILNRASIPPYTSAMCAIKPKEIARVVTPKGPKASAPWVPNTSVIRANTPMGAYCRTHCTTRYMTSAPPLKSRKRVSPDCRIVSLELTLT